MLFDWLVDDDDVDVDADGVEAVRLAAFVTDEDDCDVSLLLVLLFVTVLYVPDVDWAVVLETGGEYIFFLLIYLFIQNNTNKNKVYVFINIEI